MNDPAWTSIASLTDLADRVPHPVAVASGGELVVLRLDDSVEVLAGRCPHAGTPMATGEVSGGALVCAGHGWSFDVRSGERVDRPGPCLHRFESRVREGRVEVATDELARESRAPTSPHAPTGRADALRLAHLPGPRGLPLVGNLDLLRIRRLHRTLLAWRERYGERYAVRLPQGRVAVFCRGDTIRAVLKDRPHTFRRLGTFEPIFRELGVHGVFSAEGDAWQRQRRLVVPAFQPARLRAFHDTLGRIVERLGERWRRAAESGEPVDVGDDLQRFTVDVTTNLAFGHDLDALGEESGELGRHLEVILPQVAARTLAPFPYWRWLRLPADRALDRAMAALRGLCAELVEGARARLAAADGPSPVANTVLEALVQAREEGGGGLDDDEVFGNVLTLLIAGEDTTAHTLTWMVHFMTEHPEVQERMQQEVDEVLGGSGALPTLEHAAALRYVDAVAQEAMRLVPVATVIFLETNVDAEVEGVLLPAGTPVFLLTMAEARNPERFADPERFDPARWLNDGRAARSPHEPRSSMPFGHGPRFCPGRHLALAEIKAVAAMLCRRFSVRKIPGHPPVEEVFGFTMHPSRLTVHLAARW